MVLSDNGMESYVFPVADLNGAAKPEQSKTVNITANGTQTVTPDSGKVLSSVVINTNVPAPTVETQEKSVEITANGDSEVTPDAGKYLSKVNISVNVPTSSASKLPQVVDGTVTELTEEDLAGATSIRNYMFKGANTLMNIIIPNSVTSINLEAFMNCGLRSIAIPPSVNSIGEGAFSYCIALSSVNISEGVTSIGESAFASCSSLINIVIPNGITIIENYLLNSCRLLERVTIPESVKQIGSSALRIGSSTNKATITMLPTTPPSIQSSTFKADNLNQIIVPAGCGDAYKAATNWSNFADYIVEATA